MKIGYMAFLENMTVQELFLKAILMSYQQIKKTADTYNQLDDLLKDVLRGRADLKNVIWFQNKHILENELGFPKRNYDEMQDEFIVKEVSKLCKNNNPIDLFKDFDRKKDLILSVQKSMKFYVEYKLILVRERNIFNRIKLFMSLGLIKGLQYVICILKLIEIQKKLFVLELE